MTERDKKFLHLARGVSGDCEHLARGPSCIGEGLAESALCKVCKLANSILQLLRTAAGPDVFKYPCPGYLTIDPAGSAYLTMLDGFSAHKTVADVVGVNADFNEYGHLIGVEFTGWPLKEDKRAS